MPRATATERLARRLIAELAAVAGDRLVQWGMRALGVTWEEAEVRGDSKAGDGSWLPHTTGNSTEK